jgi:hypothetical protein
MTVWTAGKIILLTGAALVVVGAALLALSRLGVTRFPGTFTWRRGGATVIVPIGAMIVLSLLLTLVLILIFRGR